MRSHHLSPREREIEAGWFCGMAEQEFEGRLTKRVLDGPKVAGYRSKRRGSRSDLKHGDATLHYDISVELIAGFGRVRGGGQTE